MNNNQEDGTAQPLKLLLIEDNPDDAELVVQYIAGNGLHVDTEVVATEADFTCMLERQWDIILSDYNLPAFSPERALEILHEQQLSLPLLIISGELSQSQAARLMLTGARDFISKDDLSRLIPAINRELNVARLQREKVKIEEHISHLANFDEATSLPNHNYFNCTLERLNGKPNNNIYIIAHINLNRLGMISDIHGEKISNALVRETATRIHRLDDESLFARIGPNDFAFLLENRSTCDECNSACQKIYQIFDAPFLVENREHFLTPTIGVSCYPCHGNSADKILRNAKYAMRHAMRTQRTIQHYDTTIEEEDITRELISDRLQSALLHDGFKLKYQPKVSTSDGAVSAFEVLIRWNDEQLGIIPPDRFIPIAEETGNITAIGLWVLKEACFQAMEWHRQGIFSGNIAVNLSMRQLQDSHFAETVAQILTASGMPASRLELEITETDIMQDSELSIAILQQLKQLGISLVIDDFGTGYSSLSYLKRLPISCLKIDRTFISDIEASKDSMAIVEAIVALAKSLKLSLVAEGVETKTQQHLLTKMGCEEIQGYQISRPLEPIAVQDFIAGYQSQSQQRYSGY